jgi:hypothetical protein
VGELRITEVNDIHEFKNDLIEHVWRTHGDEED